MSQLHLVGTCQVLWAWGLGALSLGLRLLRLVDLCEGITTENRDALDLLHLAIRHVLAALLSRIEGSSASRRTKLDVCRTSSLGLRAFLKL